MTRLGLLAILLAATGCERPTFRAGELCSFNSDCAEPNVCAEGLGQCRRPCVDSSDCAAGARCLYLPLPDGSTAFVCQLLSETSCTNDAECEATGGPGLVCRGGTCTTECGDSRDCPPGASCQADTTTGRNTCVEPLAEICLWSEDCPGEQVCRRGQCIAECNIDAGARDCPYGKTCDPDTNLCEVACADSSECPNEGRCRLTTGTCEYFFDGGELSDGGA